MEHKTPSRFTFSMEVTPQQLEIEAALDRLDGSLHGYVSRQVVEFPDTVTLYVDAYPKSVQQFLADVADSDVLSKYVGW